MKTTNIDLYAYFGLPREKNAKGYLHGLFFDQENPRVLQIGKRLRPMVLIIPGGGYHWVSYREGEPVALRFLQKGYNAFWLEYSTDEDGVCHPTQLKEAMMALLYIYKKAASFFSDPEQIAVIGFSAGGHLAGMLASRTQDEKVLVPQYLKVEPRIKACCFSYPVVTSQGKSQGSQYTFMFLTGNNKYLEKEVSLENRVTKDFPPSFIWTTAEDTTIEPQQSEYLSKCLTAKGVKNKCIVYPHGAHGTASGDINSFNAEKLKSIPAENATWVDEAAEFFKSCGLAIQD